MDDNLGSKPKNQEILIKEVTDQLPIFFGQNFKTTFIQASQVAPRHLNSTTVINWDFDKKMYVHSELDNNKHNFVNEERGIELQDKINQFLKELSDVTYYDPLEITTNNLKQMLKVFLLGSVPFVLMYLVALSMHSKKHFTSLFWLIFIPIWIISKLILLYTFNFFHRSLSEQKWMLRSKNIYLLTHKWNMTEFAKFGLIAIIGTCSAWFEIKKNDDKFDYRLLNVQFDPGCVVEESCLNQQVLSQFILNQKDRDLENSRRKLNRKNTTEKQEFLSNILGPSWSFVDDSNSEKKKKKGKKKKKNLVGNSEQKVINESQVNVDVNFKDDNMGFEETRPDNKLSSMDIDIDQA